MVLQEQVYRDKRSNQEVRPFQLLTRVGHRGYSLKLQRAMVDFGADDAFRGVEKKLQEHYGILIGDTAIRQITLKHAERAKSYEENVEKFPQLEEGHRILSETDGSMIPVIEHPLPNLSAEQDGQRIDKRKHKKFVYKEVKLSMARLVKRGDIVVKKSDSLPKFEATIGDKEDSGKRIKHCLQSIGAGENSSIHAVGDGAKWIEEQYHKITSGKCQYLIDFYHLMEYLKPAGNTYISQKNPDTDFNRQENDQNKQAWIKAAIEKIKDNRIQEVIDELKPFAEASYCVDKPINALVTYVENRPLQFNYKEAIAAGLPIGSGEIESAHKSLIQQRLKISGACWDIQNADYMIALRAMIANGHWENYWRDHIINARLFR